MIAKNCGYEGCVGRMVAGGVGFDEGGQKQLWNYHNESL